MSGFASVQDALVDVDLRVEQVKGHLQSSPMVFSVIRDTNGIYHYMTPIRFNEYLDLLTSVFMGDTGAALQHLTETLPMTLKMLRTMPGLDAGFIGLGIRAEGYQVEAPPGVSPADVARQVEEEMEAGGQCRHVTFVHLIQRDGRHVHLERHCDQDTEFFDDPIEERDSENPLYWLAVLLDSLVPEDVFSQKEEG